jgi:2-polyprenyl-3-methyl-5-hydroxy-6-metoxy-1,4-benzoquinol methylase
VYHPNALKKFAQKARSICTFWCAEQTLEHLREIRLYELGVILDILTVSPEDRVLEIGAGKGWQAQAMKNLGYNIKAIEIAPSNNRNHRVYQVTEYNGRNIPFDNSTFDIVISSNVLEHIPHVYEFQEEIHRILKPNGYVLHVLPSSSWRLWTNITNLLKCWKIPKSHGKHAGNALREIQYFRRAWWVRLFSETGWTVLIQDTNGLFYTGHSIMDSRLSMIMRNKLSHVLGSSCNIFLMRKNEQFQKIGSFAQ